MLLVSYILNNFFRRPETSIDWPGTFAASAWATRDAGQPSVFQPQPGLSLCFAKPLCIPNTNPAGRGPGAGWCGAGPHWQQSHGGGQCQRRIHWPASGSQSQFHLSRTWWWAGAENIEERRPLFRGDWSGSMWFREGTDLSGSVLRLSGQCACTWSGVLDGGPLWKSSFLWG